MNGIQLNSDQFNSRCLKITKKLNSPVLLFLGKSSDVEDFNMNSALFHYLLGYEFPETIIVVQEHPIIITSPKKAIFLQQVKGLKITIKNKDDSNLNEIIGSLSEVYGVVDQENSKGEFCSKILTSCKTRDVTAQITELMSVKESNELDYIMKSGLVSNYLLQKGIDLIRDGEFTKETLENCMNDRIRGVNNNAIEFSFDPECDEYYLRLGIRYKGYCTEIARPFLQDLSDEYDIQKYVLGLIRPGTVSNLILDDTKSFMASKGYTNDVKIYTLGLMDNELGFDKGFELKNDMVFCLNIDDRFCSTFMINDLPIFVTKKDSKEDYSVSRMRFRNKGNDAILISKMKEHQSELLDRLIEDSTAYYKDHKDTEIVEKKDTKDICIYEKDSFIPRSDKVSLDWDNMYVIVPILSYSVPFHISAIKNVSIVMHGDEPRLRINFKDSKEIKEMAKGIYDTKIKFITARSSNADELLSQINDMRKEFNKPNISIKDQPVLKERFKKYALTDLYMRTDNKATNKKTLGNLELHENGFKYNDIHILFSNIKNMFYQIGDFDNRAILHFNLKEPVMHVKPTRNVQLFKKFNTSYHDTSKREDEHLEMIHEKEEEEEISRFNSEFFSFVERIEQETRIKVQIPEKGFLGVHSTFIAKLNGVERIKLNLGIELLKEPSIILLDEPTTGLDSSSALNVLSVIKKIADLGKTVLITIHQPSCKMLSYFDKIILMSRSSVVFQGKLDRCIDFFAECGHECPVKTTPSEFFLDILALDPKNDDTIDDSVKRINSIKKEFDFIKDIEEPTIKEEVQVSLQPPLSTSFEMILKRSVVNFFRNFPYIKMKLIQKAIIACLFGATFYGLGVVKADVFSFRGVMTFLFQGELFGVTSPIFNLFHMEKKIIRRERMSGLYSGYQIFYAKFISEALLHFIYAIPYNLIIYILVGLRREVSVMLSFFIIIFTIIIYSISFALFISIVTSSTSSAQVVGMTLNVVFLIYSGAFSNPTKLPSPLKWIVWASPLHYAFRAILYNQLGDLKTTVSAPTPLIVYGRDTLKYFGLKGCEMWESIFYLLLYSIAFQVLGATILHYGTVNNLKLSKKAGVDQI